DVRDIAIDAARCAQDVAIDASLDLRDFAIDAGLFARDLAVDFGHAASRVRPPALPALKGSPISGNTISTALLAAGIVLLLYAVALQLELVSVVELPKPVALENNRVSAGAQRLMT